MKVYLGSDHAGFTAKEQLMLKLSELGYDVEDVGDKVLDPKDDYPQFAYLAVTKILGDPDDDAKGILLCGSGQGMCITANRSRGIRAVTAWNEELARETRHDDDANVLCLPARSLSLEQMLSIA
ncbi:MAG TPA: RpiB/LacA/LacB family sugar-phosphate isomerase, partial [Candidatus Acidoferrum sp.]|nr:RpiB/LacA/LacB family sugar-phosphate isomerase [Candidatus Acidoferrum sp.]